VLDVEGRLMQRALREDMRFTLQFVELRTLEQKEKWLLSKALWIATNYGAMGGKTTRKPQRNTRVGRDCGLIEWESGTRVDGGVQQIRDYLAKHEWRQVQRGTPDLRWFFFIKGAFLDRIAMNRLMGLSDDGKRVVSDEPWQKALRGQRGDATQPAISKKIFSFRGGGKRVWGYVGDAMMRDTVVEHLTEQLGKGRWSIKTGEEVLNEL
jgi:hypothetical protein